MGGMAVIRQNGDHMAEVESSYRDKAIKAARSLRPRSGGALTIKGWEDRPTMDDWAEMGFTFTSSGLEFAKNIKQDDFVKLGGFVGLINNASKLWVGDWCAYGQRRWNYTRAELASMTGLDPETIDNYVSVGRKVPAGNRFPGLTPRHFAAAAGLDRRKQAKVLGAASLHNWSSDMVRAKVNAHNEFGWPLDDDPVWPADVKQERKERKERAEAAEAARVAAELAAKRQPVPVVREMVHSDDYTLALLRDSVESLPELFEVESITQDTEIEITISACGLAHLLALLDSDLGDELEIGVKVSEIKST